MSEIPNYVSSDEEKTEVKEVDPFRHRIRMTKLQWVRTYVQGAVLIPIRILVLALVMAISWILATVTLIGVTDEDLQQKPMTGWRKTSKWWSAALGRAMLTAAGFRVKVIGKQVSPEEAPVLVAAPHSTYFDAIAIFWSDTAYTVSRAENRKLLVIGKCIDMAQTLSVSRENKDSKQNTVKEIIRRTSTCDAQNPDDRWGQLLLFPEGSTANRTALMSFKPGAFYPGKPIQPVLVRYNNPIDTVTWTWNQPHGSKTILFTTLAQLINNVEIEYLPVYHPSKEEKKDAKLFAKNVRRVMADALEIPTCDLTFEEAKERYAKLYKKKVKSKED